MTRDDNNVNINARLRQSYHHGDLRTALIDAGLSLLASGPADALSLRGMARAAGVSATAVYRHFPDKAALLAALAAEGLVRLGEAQRQAAVAAGGGLAGFIATGRAYVRFALSNPALFRLAVATPGDAAAPDTEPGALLRANAAAHLGLPPDHPEVTVLALRVWSRAHGLAMLMLDGQIPASDAIIDQVIG